VKNVANNLRYWCIGLLVALAGATSARWIAPMYTGHLRLALTLGGQLVAFSGLFIICLGVRRRIQQASAPGPEEA